MLVQSGVGNVIADVFANSSLPIILLAYITAALIRIAQGSGTVAIITASSLVKPLLELVEVSEPMLAIIAVVIGCGAIICSHLNDSSFWLTKRYFGLTEGQTLRSWTVATTVISFTGFITCFIISLFL